MSNNANQENDAENTKKTNDRLFTLDVCDIGLIVGFILGFCIATIIYYPVI